MNYGASAAAILDKRQGGDSKMRRLPMKSGYPFFNTTLAQRTCVQDSG